MNSADSTRTADSVRAIQWEHSRLRLLDQRKLPASFEYLTLDSAEGVASATTRSVVVSSLSVLGLDFILTAMMFSI